MSLNYFIKKLARGINIKRNIRNAILGERVLATVLVKLLNARRLLNAMTSVTKLIPPLNVSAS